MQLLKFGVACRADKKILEDWHFTAYLVQGFFAKYGDDCSLNAARVKDEEFAGTSALSLFLLAVGYIASFPRFFGRQVELVAD